MDKEPREMRATPSDAELHALLAKQALHELSMRYARAIDRRDQALLLSVYHEDAIDHHGTLFKGSPQAYADWQPEVMAPFDVTAHHITNTAFRLDGDKAEGEIYFMAYHRMSGAEPKEVVVGGRYLDRYERRAAVWKIAHRTLVWDFARTTPVQPGQLEFLNSLGALGGGATDISFTVLALFRSE